MRRGMFPKPRLKPKSESPPCRTKCDKDAAPSGFLHPCCEILRGIFDAETLSMACNPEVLKHVPLFALLDEEETAVLAGQVRLKTFSPRQRIYKIGDSSGQAYVVVSGRVRVATVDQDQQEVVVDEPSHGEFFGFASMLEQTPHQTQAEAIDGAECLEVNRNDIAVLLQRKPLAGMDMLTVLGRQFHASQQLVRLRANRHPNERSEERR